MSLCAIIGAQNGRILRPREHDHLVFYLRDLSLPKPDKWGTSQLLAWLQQVKGGFMHQIIIFFKYINF